MDFPSGAVVSSPWILVLVDFPPFRLAVALTLDAALGADLFAAPLTKALVAFLVGGSDAYFSLVELLVERGAAASESEVLDGLDDDAVGSKSFFCLFGAAVPVLSAAVLALRLAGAMITDALESSASEI